jgi:tRNA pseudouridine32 synthase/23S rRNA pseudouridine746 synthase
MYSIIENHKDFLLISKHPGVSFHKNGEARGLSEVLRSDLGIHDLYTVHRLDTMTSGLLLFARSRAVAGELAYQFQNRLVEKYYLAISDRRPKKKQGFIKGDMKKARRGAWKLSRSIENPAVTQFFSYPMGGGMRLFIMKPHTGRTHQIRVAMKSLGSPVLGDPLYHKKEKAEEQPDRGYLHSYAVRFHLSGKDYAFIHKPEEGKYFNGMVFMETLKCCEEPWVLKWTSL